jgi:hypothetical protein
LGARGGLQQAERADRIGVSRETAGGFYVSMDACRRNCDVDLRFVFSCAR